MKKVLYISNIEVPYRTEFFNQLSEKCDLTVLYERKKSKNRDAKWTTSLKSKFNILFLNGIKVKNEYCFNPFIFKYVLSNKYDKIIIGCYNSPSQILAILFMRIFHKKYILNLDGECFLEENTFKNKIKKMLLKGADSYLIAGNNSACNLKKCLNTNNIYPYYFSSLKKQEIIDNSKELNKNINDCVLVVGQYFDYKGLDVALEIAKNDSKTKYKFIGSGIRSNLLSERVNKMGLSNVEIIPFLEKKDLYTEYQQCKCLLLTSRQECWGLVINEAASFGCPIVATKGSGAAVEFLDSYVCDSIDDVLLKIHDDNYLNNIKSILLEKSKKYYIEKNVIETLKVIEKKGE